MRGRGQLVAAIVVVVAVAATAIGLQRGVGPKALAGPPPATAPSGGWFCPHGGGTGWRTTLEVANPGDAPVRIRVTGLTEDRPTPPRDYTVEPGAEILLPSQTPSRASSSLIEYFGGWVAAAWVAHAGGEESGVASEPCAPAAGGTWLLPDGSTQLVEEATGPPRRRELQSWVVVMNPFAADAVFSLTIYTDRDAPVRVGKWTNVALGPFRSRAFLLNEQALGYATVSASVEARVGRVVASSLDISAVGGIRASLGQLAPLSASGVTPVGFDQGRTELVLMNTTTEQVHATGTVLGRTDPVPIGAADEARADPESAQTLPIATDGPSALDVVVPAGAAVIRRTYGKTSDQAATAPGVPARSWVVLPAIAGRPSNPGVVVTNPGPRPIEVTLSVLPADGEPRAAPTTIRVPGLRTVALPSRFVQAHPLGAILAVSPDGTFVPAAASYSLGREGYATFAVALGVPVPDTRVPSDA